LHPGNVVWFHHGTTVLYCAVYGECLHKHALSREILSYGFLQFRPWDRGRGFWCWVLGVRLRARCDSGRVQIGVSRNTTRSAALMTPEIRKGREGKVFSKPARGCTACRVLWYGMMMRAELCPLPAYGGYSTVLVGLQNSSKADFRF
jgi:hypothetical protein